ncbi:MAG: cbb3-type cytochrome c oxidase subunit I [Spirochaetia bacterium]|nr:cbb3-type cytochrome c oxidase subunit I [Spirochaetia bacterium]
MIALTPDFRKVISLHLFAGVIWILVAVVFGLLNQLQLMMGFPSPDVLGFGIIRPLFTNALIFGGWVGVITAASYFLLQKEGELKWQWVALSGFALQQLALILGVITILCGFNKGREYGEWSWVSDNLYFLSLALFVVVALRSAKSELSAPALYVLIGFAGGAVTFLLGNLSLPYSPFGSTPLTAGMPDASVQEFYRMGILGFLVLFPLFGLLYYLLPAHLKLPIYNEGALKFQAVTMAFLIPVSGSAFLALGPGPQKTATAGIIFGIALTVVILMGTWNLLYTISRGPHAVELDRDGAFMRWTLRFLLLLTLLRAISLPRFMQAHVGLTWWNSQDIASDILILTALGASGIGLLFSQRFTGKSTTGGGAGLALFFAVMGSFLLIATNVVQGVVEGSAAAELTDAGTLAHPSYLAVLFAGNLADPSTSPTLQYLLGFRGLYLFGYLSTALSLFAWAFAILSVWRGNGEAYKEPDLHLPEEEVHSQEAH